jgi:hypothetical protein
MPELPPLPAIERAIVAATNDHRARAQLPALTADPRLNVAARTYARHLAASGLFSHTADGRTATERATVAGYGACSIAENIARWSYTVTSATQAGQAIVTAWLGSAAHRHSIELEPVSHIGTGVARAPSGALAVVQLFGQPVTARYELVIENTADTVIPYRFGAEEATAPPASRLTIRKCAPLVLTVTLPNGRPFKLTVPREGTRVLIERSPEGALTVQSTK